MREQFRIVTNQLVRDSRVERRIIEYNRERDAMMLMLAGGVITLLAILW